MMSNELAGIFMCFIFGLIGTYLSWRAWTQKQVNYRSQCYRREDSPFAFWFILSFQILWTVLLILFGIYLSIHLLRSSWRTVDTSTHTPRIAAHENAAPSAHRHHARLPCWVHHAEPLRPVSFLQQRAVPESETHHL
ncbi:hypothetical protein [Prosthecobacter sp.]|uniref:hypothetical protein n=1 Tax=Prosthecobacter sp. TaxID=1965333 RepID=UPI0037852EB1